MKKISVMSINNEIYWRNNQRNVSMKAINDNENDVKEKYGEEMWRNEAKKMKAYHQKESERKWRRNEIVMAKISVMKWKESS